MFITCEKARRGTAAARQAIRTQTVADGVPKTVAAGRLAEALQQIRSEGAPAVRVQLLLEAADVRLSVSRHA